MALALICGLLGGFKVDFELVWVGLELNRYATGLAMALGLLESVEQVLGIHFLTSPRQT